MKTVSKMSLVCALACASFTSGVLADAEAMARALQDPLGNTRMLATDNTIAFNSGEDEGDTNYNFQLQPVYSLDRPEGAKTNMILRAVVPISALNPVPKIPLSFPNQRQILVASGV